MAISYGYKLWLYKLWLYKLWLYKLWLYKLWLYKLWLYKLWLYKLWPWLAHAPQLACRRATVGRGRDVAAREITLPKGNKAFILLAMASCQAMAHGNGHVAHSYSHNTAQMFTETCLVIPVAGLDLIPGSNKSKKKSK